MCFPRNSPNVHAVFERKVFNFCARVLWAYVDPLTKGVRVFFAGKRIPHGLNILKTKRPSIWQKETKIHGSVTGWQELVEHVCKTSEYISRKRRELPHLDIFGAFTLNQPVPGCGVPCRWHQNNAMVRAPEKTRKKKVHHSPTKQRWVTSHSWCRNRQFCLPHFSLIC